MCRVIGRSKLTKTHMFERLRKSLKVFENIESIKLFTLYGGENEKQPSYWLVEPSVGLNWEKCTFWKLSKSDENFGAWSRPGGGGGGGDNFFRVNWLKISGHIYQGNLFISYYWTNFEQSPYGFKTQFCYFK